MIPELPEIEQPLLTPENVSAPHRILRIGRTRKVAAGGFSKDFATMFAIAHAGTVPPIDENPIHAVASDNLLLYLSHELKVVGAMRAGDPHLRRCPMTALVTARINCYPIRMRVVHVIISGMRIGASDDNHTKVSTAGDQLSEWIGVAQPLTAMMERNLRGIVRNASSRAQANGVRPGAPEIVEPELRLELAG